MIPIVFLGLIAVAVVGLIVAVVGSDDDDMDHDEYNDWERLR